MVNMKSILELKLRHFLCIVFVASTLLVFTGIYLMMGEVENGGDVRWAEEKTVHTNASEEQTVHSEASDEQTVHSEASDEQTIHSEESEELVGDDVSSIFDEFQEITYEGIDRRFRVLDDGNYRDFVVDRVVSPVVNALQHAESTELPIILWWTPFSHDNGVIKRCWVGDCYFTQNRTFYNHSLAKAFLFYGSDFKISSLPLPRQEHHEWGLFHEESPKNEAMFLYKDVLEVFNHTATFRQESSYPITTQYVVSASYLLKKLKYTVHEKDEMKREHRMASVVYIQTGCNPPSDRDAYINEMQKYIPIDCYGQCLHNKDLPKQYVDPLTMFDKGFIEILEKYKFIISFENGICNDYITEKLYRTLHVGAVPIYKGAPNVRDWLPTNQSAIVADDFETPKHLADYINFVDQNPSEYEKYLAYKHTGITNALLKETLSSRQWGVDTIYKMSNVVGFECHVCDAIHKNRKLKLAGKLPISHKASFEHYGCPLPKRYDLPSIPGHEDWEREAWFWEYQDAAKRVDELKKLMKMGR